MSRGYTTICKPYKKLRRRQLLISTVCLAICMIIFLMIFGIKNGSWKDGFYGINRVYLALGLIFVLFFLYNLVFWVFGIDTLQIKRLIKNYPSGEEEILYNLERGKVYLSGSTDSFLVSPKYCLFCSKERYHLVANRDIDKLGIDSKMLNNVVKDYMICKLKNGERYEMYINRINVQEIADYLEKAVSGQW